MPSKHQRKLALTLVLLICLGGCGVQIHPPPNIQPRQPNVVSLDPQDWYIFYSNNMPAHPSGDPTGAWSFNFPALDSGGHVNYIETPFSATATLHDVTVTFRVESNNPQYAVIDPGDHPPATVHLFFEQQNDDLRNPNGRWWAGASGYNLGSQDNSTITFIIPLTPDQWSNVQGQQDSAAFYAALQNIGWIGVTCGGQYFWGHGVALTVGSAKYVLVNLGVN
jgi:hypothetical protein